MDVGELSTGVWYMNMCICEAMGYGDGHNGGQSNTIVRPVTTYSGPVRACVLSVVEI